MGGGKARASMRRSSGLVRCSGTQPGCRRRFSASMRALCSAMSVCRMADTSTVRSVCGGRGGSSSRWQDSVHGTVAQACNSCVIVRRQVSGVRCRESGVGRQVSGVRRQESRVAGWSIPRNSRKAISRKFRNVSLRAPPSAPWRPVTHPRVGGVERGEEADRVEQLVGEMRVVVFQNLGLGWWGLGWWGSGLFRERLGVRAQAVNAG